MNKIGSPTYLSNPKESLMVTAAGIDVGHVPHGPPLDINYFLDQLQRSIKDVKLWCGDNDILNNITLQVLLARRQLCQRRGE